MHTHVHAHFSLGEYYMFLTKVTLPQEDME